MIHRIGELPGRVVRHGPCDDAEVGRLYRSADMFVLPSRWETYGTAFAEAMDAGLPVIGWRCGNLPHLVDNGKQGIVLTPGDIRALAVALRRLAEDEHERRRMGAAAARRAQDLPTWEQSAQTVLRHPRGAAMTLGWNNPTAQPTITVLLRHGDTRLSPEHRLSGLRDLPLSADGTRQAKAAACRLAAGARIDAVISSPLRRAAATAAIAASELGLTAATDDDLRETASATGKASPWQKSSNDGPKLLPPGSITPSRHRRAVRASPTPHTGSTGPVTGYCETTVARRSWW